MTDAASSLRLRAADAEDFRVVAACLQDALVPVGEMVFDPAGREFVLVANRYCWEGEPANSAGKPGMRVHCALHFTGVDAVRRRSLDPLAHGTILDLLTVDLRDGAVELLFAGDAAIRLEGAAIGCRLRDLGEPWPAAARPRHPAP
jgi:hypothetical protein